MDFKKIVIIGGGILGTQIAFQTAYSGFDVTIVVRKDSDQTKLRGNLRKLKEKYLDLIEHMSKKNPESWIRGIADIDDFDKDECIKKATYAYEKINISDDYETALDDVDLVIESITENIDDKNSLYEEISGYLPKKTIVVTNSSTLLPSKMANATKRPEQFLALHFANNIWKNNIAEIMGHDKTSEEAFNNVIEFAKRIKMIPLPAFEEKSGYLLNSMLVPFLLSGMDLLANGISDAETIDKAWTLGTGAPKGPFQIIDTVGLETARNIILQYQKVPNIFDPLLKKMMLPYNFDGMLRILDQYIAEGKMGVSTGEGFYKYED